MNTDSVYVMCERKQSFNCEESALRFDEAWRKAEFKRYLKMRKAKRDYGFAFNETRHRRKNGRAYHAMRAYECPVCGLWHLTSKGNHEE